MTEEGGNGGGGGNDGAGGNDGLRLTRDTR